MELQKYNLSKVVETLEAPAHPAAQPKKCAEDGCEAQITQYVSTPAGLRGLCRQHRQEYLREKRAKVLA